MDTPEKYNIQEWFNKYYNKDSVGLDNLFPFHGEYLAQKLNTIVPPSLKKADSDLFKIEAGVHPELSFDFDSKSITERLMENLAQRTVKRQDDRFIAILKESGYIFENNQELEQFAKERCTLEKGDNKQCVLSVDGKPIASWWDTVRFEQNGNTFTAIMGEKPE